MPKAPDTHKPPVHLEIAGGRILAPVVPTRFGDRIDLAGLIPEDCGCIMVLVATSSGLEAGHPQPVGFVRLRHQLYLKDIETLLATEQPVKPFHPAPPDIRLITVAPFRSRDYVDLWEPAHKTSKPPQ